MNFTQRTQLDLLLVNKISLNRYRLSYAKHGDNVPKRNFSQKTQYRFRPSINLDAIHLQQELKGYVTIGAG